MIFSKKSLDGYLLIDNRNNAGVPEVMSHARGAPVVRGGQTFEISTFTCSHCGVPVIPNPLRTRERGYCSSCDHYICDICTVAYHQTKVCYPFKRRIAELREAAFKAKENVNG